MGTGAGGDALLYCCSAASSQLNSVFTVFSWASYSSRLVVHYVIGSQIILLLIAHPQERGDLNSGPKMDGDGLIFALR